MEQQLIKKALLMLCVISIFTGAMPIAVAEVNRTNQTNQTNITETPVVVATTISSVTVKEAKFRVGPTVKLRPVNDLINKSSYGLIELYMDNPYLNVVKLNVDVCISVPAGIQVYGKGFGEAGAAGTVYGTFI